MWFVVKRSRSRLNLTVSTALLGSMCLHFGTALHCTLIISLRITEMCEDEEMHNILQCLQKQTERIENLFVDDNVPLATEDFRRFYVQNLMSRDLNVTSTKQLKRKPWVEKVSKKLRNQVHLILEKSEEFQRLNARSKQIKKKTKSRMQRGNSPTIFLRTISIIYRLLVLKFM